jgi:DNA-binding SARP family transcriptional activator
MQADRLRLTTYGGFHLIRKKTEEPVHIRGKKTEALCAYLVLVGGTAKRETLRTLLWHNVSWKAGRHSLSQTVSELRVQLSPIHEHAVISSYDSVSLTPHLIHADVHAAERLLRRKTRQALQLASRLCTGEFLAGMNLREPAFDAWLAAHRRHARELAYEAHWLCTFDAMAQGKTVDALLSALRLVEINPLDDRGHLLLMTLYLEQGQVGAALRQYDTCARLLDLALQPRLRPEMDELRRRLVASREASGKPAGDIAAEFAPPDADE